MIIMTAIILSLSVYSNNEMVLWFLPFLLSIITITLHIITDLFALQKYSYMASGFFLLADDDDDDDNDEDYNNNDSGGGDGGCGGGCDGGDDNCNDNDDDDDDNNNDNCNYVYLQLK